MSATRAWILPLSLSGLVVFAARDLLQRRPLRDLRGQTAVVTGGSRGLGLALARQLVEQGCRVAICARDQGELERARVDLEGRGGQVLASVCDVSDRAQVQQFIAETTRRFGRIDILINNAGVITVGPMEHQTVEDFSEALDIMFWGTVYPTLEVMPAMRARHAGDIVNITSVGGKVSVPRLLPYSCAKFAAVGFSEGAHADLAQYGINVLTVVPGLMRTGSHLNARFKGQHRQEFTWFSLGATLPVTSMSAEDAARRIVRGIRARETELILTWQANLIARLQGLLPGLGSQAHAVINRALPAPGGVGSSSVIGQASQTPLTELPVEALGQAAARRLNQ